MKRQRGQISILIAILFQVLFIFFAMVINVGLLIHDKINLQNSVDIAAYYGAMKQAEVFNAMSHVNFQMRQNWKLLSWRLWTLGDAGRNRDFTNFIANVSSTAPLADGPPTYITNNNFFGPLVCVQNPFWYENNWNIQNGRGVSRISSIQNLCKDSKVNYQLPVIPDFGLTRLPLVGQILGPLFQFSRQSAARVTDKCNAAGVENYTFAFKLLASFKNASRDRRLAMKKLQDLFIKGGKNGDNFIDLFGNPVRPTVEKTFRDNLTTSNLSGVSEFDFRQSLTEPFLTPIEVRTFIKYMDLYGSTSRCDGRPQDIMIKPRNMPVGMQDLVNAAMFYAASDYGQTSPTSAEAFASESSSGSTPPRSTVGFEKNPWALAYVHVRAKTKPRMIFSPFGTNTVELQAESFAMPFGGRIGPWYGTTWQPGDGQSTGDGNSKVDPLLPTRIGSGGVTSASTHPNYSRFPGDRYGASSRLARSAGLFAVQSKRGANDQFLPRHKIDDYGLLLETDGDPNEDLIVYNKVGNKNLPIRQVETAAISPDLFDAAYYSIKKDFNSWIFKIGGQQEAFVHQQVCNNKCFDFGTSKADATNRQYFSLERQIASVGGALTGSEFWLVRDADHLNTSWSEGLSNPVTYTTEGVGAPEASGGRSGYSVKIVSRRFLTRPDLSLGGGSVSGSIRNPPR